MCFNVWESVSYEGGGIQIMAMENRVNWWIDKLNWLFWLMKFGYFLGVWEFEYLWIYGLGISFIFGTLKY